LLNIIYFLKKLINFFLLKAMKKRSNEEMKSFNLEQFEEK
jgi:hypothetical protein